MKKLRLHYSAYLLLVLIFLCFENPLTGQTVLHPTDDTYAHMDDNATNYGSDSLLYSINNLSGTQELQIYMKFDISGITEPIESAVLRLFVFAAPSPDHRKIVTVSDDSWDEMSLTWDNKPAPGDSIGHIIPNEIGEWVEVEIGDYVAQEKSDGFVSIALIATDSDGWLRFKSRQSVLNKPELVINRPNLYGVFFKENFGSGDYFDGIASEFGNYSSTATFSDDTIRIQNFSPSDYEGASGGNFLWLGRVKTEPPVQDRPRVIMSGISTTGYENVVLSIGHTVWAGSADAYLDIYYSIDGNIWTQIDNNNIYAGEWAPTGAWGEVTLGTPLPQADNLHLKFENLNTAQSVRIDDIQLVNLEVDGIPPTQPENLATSNLSPWGFILTWEKSTDNVAVSRYEIYKNGSLFGTTTESYFEVERQTPGASVDFSVIAYDENENASPASAILTVSLPEDATGEGRPLVWNKDQATVMANGDLQWNPNPFEFNPGNSIRYIDYENGDDNADGQSKATAWKHHPWDPSAGGNAASESGIHTYVFKKGVIYRGELFAEESGTPMENIQLTSDPSWGTGEAMFYGSIRIEDGWTKADATSAPDIPEPEKAYYIDLNAGLPETKTVVEISGNSFNRLNLARTPNWQVNDSIYPMEEWWKWTDVEGNETQSGKLIDKNNLTQSDPQYWTGGTVWSEWQGTMGTVWGQEIQSFDPATNSIVTPYIYGGEGKRYYIENLPHLLDTTMEYWFDKSGDFPGRLYLRLSNDRDPNTTTIEVATKNRLITITDQQYISISGLSFALTTSNRTHFGDGAAKDIDAIVNLDGYCHHIEIMNCNFEHVNAGIAVENVSDPGLNVNNILVADNNMRYVSDKPITFSSGGGKYMEDISILRNKIYLNGFRQLNRWYSAIPAITGYFKSGVVAGNFVDYSWGSGIYTFWGKGTNDNTRSIPFIRGFVYHNRAENTLLGTSDWGGIEHWQGGPVYLYNNYSKNAHGWQGSMENNTWNPWAFPYYFDGSFKLYAFNNIAVSPFNSLTDPSKRNRAGYQMVLGTFDMLANNTSHNFFMGIISQANDGGVPAHNTYLGNILSKTSHTYFNQSKTPTDKIPFNAYANNIFSGSAGIYWDYQGGTARSFDEFQDKLEELNALSAQLGWEASYNVIPNADENNFVPATTGEAIDRGVKVFVPFALKAVVGEWHFYKHNNDSSLVSGENFYMTDEYEHRGMYYSIPKNNLKVHNVKWESYTMGELEDWTEGALQFDGEATYAVVESELPQQQLVSNDLDMTTEDFIIEAYFKTEENHAGSVVVSKSGNGTSGYSIGIDASGHAKVSLMVSGSEAISLSSVAAVNDGNWHHILAEVSRNSGLNIYIDGELNNGSTAGSMPDPSLSLQNDADFLIGKDYNDNYFAGTIDFVRVSKGNLIDARTTIDELYQWQFDGPFLYDFAGNAPIGKRDAGALEAGERTCDLTVTPSSLEFDENGGSEDLAISGSTEFELLENEDEFLTLGVTDQTLKVTVASNSSVDDRASIIKLVGCNETVQIPVIQKGKTTDVNESEETFSVYPNPAKDKLYVIHNQSKNVPVKLYDLSGHLKISKDHINNNESIDISSLSPGIYLLHTKINNKKSITKVIIN